MKGTILAAGTVLCFFVSTNVFSQTSVSPAVAERIAGLKVRMDHYRSVAERLQPIEDRLSAGARSMLSLAKKWPSLEPRLPQILSAAGSGLAPVDVTNRGSDARITRFGGQTQSETSVAWAGSRVVIGFNDSGSLAATSLCSPGHCPSPSDSLTIDGIARSEDKGATYKDQRIFVPDPVPAGSRFYDLSGDPVVVARNINIFYFVSLATNTPKVSCAGGAGSCSDISIQRSTDGGATWGGAIPAASKDGSTHFLDKPWATLDRSNPATMYITYTDFDGSGVGCGGFPRAAIELVRSDNGGATWGNPTVVAEYCDAEFAQGSQVVVGPGGVVYVAYEHFNADFCTRDLRIHRSNNGFSFNSGVIVSNITAVGDGLRMQGDFRPGFEFPTLAVDRSGGSANGNVYLAWHDGRRVQVDDPLGLCGFYNYADVYFSRSTNGGSSWTSPQRVNPGSEPLSSGLGTDQYQPAMAVDVNGKIAVTWYDRAKSRENWLILRTAAVSTNAGTNWTILGPISSGSWPSLVGQDFFVGVDYHGDYDTTTVDTTGANSGFINSFSTGKSGSQDVQASKF